MSETVYTLGKQLTISDKNKVIREKCEAVFLTSLENCTKLLAEIGMQFDGDTSFGDDICKVEAQQECVFGMFAVPKLSDIWGKRYRFCIFVNKSYIVIAEDDNFSHKLVDRIQQRKINQGENKEKFLYNFMAEFIRPDVEMLTRYERRIIALEDEVMDGDLDEFYKKLMPIRKELLELRGYYDELSDSAKEFEDDENDIFDEERLKFFGTISDRAIGSWAKLPIFWNLHSK